MILQRLYDSRIKQLRISCIHESIQCIDSKLFIFSGFSILGSKTSQKLDRVGTDGKSSTLRSLLARFDSLRVQFIFIISAVAGILLKPQDVYFFFSKVLCMILNNSDILFGSEYKREI